jgi:hypothetical protein
MAYYQNVDNNQIEEFETDPGSEWIQRTKVDGAKLQHEQACTELRKLLKPDDTVNTILRHCSRSGMRRHISLLTDGLTDITHYAALAMGGKRADDGGIKVDGCGMDMGFDLVYRLGHILWPSGTSKPHGTRNGEPDTDGGYALKHRWL